MAEEEYATNATETKKGVSTPQILAVVTVFPIGVILLTLAGLTFTGTLIGLALSTPLFVICSPVLVPASIIIGLAVVGFVTSGAFGLTGLSSLSWIFKYVCDSFKSMSQKQKRGIEKRVRGY